MKQHSDDIERNNQIHRSGDNSEFSDSDNFYILPDGEDDGYDGDDDNDDEEEDGMLSSSNKKSSFLLLYKILLHPVEGWKALRRSNKKPEQLQSECFYPLLALLAICKFADLFYSPRTSLSEILVEAVIAFVSFFFGYFCILLILKSILPYKIGLQFQENFGKSFVIISLSSLCMFGIFIELLPMLWPILIFLPLWTIYIICKGIKFFKLPERGILRFTVILCLTIIGVPLLIDNLLDMVLPF